MEKREEINMAKKNRREVDRREFLKVLGVGTATTTAAL